MLIENLHKKWLQLAEKYFEDILEINLLWKKIRQNYTSKNRYYHNLSHINSMLAKASENKSEIENYDEVLFAIWFHDIIYKSTSKNNEEQSAEFLKSILKKVSEEKINKNMIYQLIISTKSHQIIGKENLDNAFLLDFDLAILGSDWNVYQTYIKSIRREYKIYPSFLYNPARKKVLMSFLERDKLFFTAKYQSLLEAKARENLVKELELLD